MNYLLLQVEFAESNTVIKQKKLNTRTKVRKWCLTAMEGGENSFV